MIYDVELFNKSILSIELEEMTFGDNKYEYKISNFIKLLENLGCTQYISDLRSQDGYALISMTLSDELVKQVETDEGQFLERIEEVVMMMFLEDGPARYLPPIFPSTTGAIGDLMKALDKVTEKLEGLTPEEQVEEVNKIIGDLGLGGLVGAETIDKDAAVQEELAESMNDLLVEINGDTFSVFGFSGNLTEQLNAHYGIDFSKIAKEIGDNEFKPVDIHGEVINFDNEEQLIEWASERFLIY